MKKIKMRLEEYEWNIIIRSLNDLRTSLIKQERHTDTVDDILLKVIRGTKKVKGS